VVGNIRIGPWKRTFHRIINRVENEATSHQPDQ
jgi:hypothetical protein